MPNLPSGTVTFLFSDVEGSTELLKRLGDDGYTQVLEEHRRLLRAAFASRDGQEIDTQGDAFFYSFPRARDAVVAAVEAQRALASAEWPDGTAVRIRIGLHTGEPTVGDEGYTGLDVVRGTDRRRRARRADPPIRDDSGAPGRCRARGRRGARGRRAAAQGHRSPRAPARADDRRDAVVAPGGQIRSVSAGGRHDVEAFAERMQRTIEQRVLREIERRFDGPEHER